MQSTVVTISLKSSGYKLTYQGAEVVGDVFDADGNRIGHLSVSAVDPLPAPDPGVERHFARQSRPCMGCGDSPLGE